MRVVIDANVAIASAATRGLCEAILALCLEQHQIILCRGILDEIDRKLGLKLRVPRPIVLEFIKFLEGNAEIVQPEPVDANACRDPNDLMVLGAALRGGADVIITGDKDLLSLKEFKGIKILTPRTFWETNQKQK